jgi:hypothetical protein
MSYRPYLIIAITFTLLQFVVLLLRINNAINYEFFDTMGISLVIGAISFAVLVKNRPRNKNLSNSQ